MKKVQINFVIDAVSFVLFTLLLSTGILMFYVLPPGRGGHGASILGLGRHGWGELHFWISMAFLAAMTLHLFMHWRWVVAVARGRTTAQGAARVRVLVGGAALMALAALAAAPLLAPIDRAGPQQGEMLRLEAPATPDAQPALHGGMTLREVAAAAGVAPESLAQRLDSAHPYPLDTPLRTLHERHGLTMNAVRQALAAPPEQRP